MVRGVMGTFSTRFSFIRRNDYALCFMCIILSRTQGIFSILSGGDFPTSPSIAPPEENFAPPVKHLFPSVNIFSLRGNKEAENQTFNFIADVNLLRNFSENMDTFYHKLVVGLFVLRTTAVF